MKDRDKTKEQLINELGQMRRWIGELGAPKVDCKKAEEALKESAERLRSLLENISDFVITVERNHKILMINRGVPGVTAEQAKGTKLYNYVEPAHHEIMRESLEKVFQTGMPEKYEALGMGPKGPNTAWYETRVFPNKRDDRVIFVTLISSDITERKKAEEVLKESEEKFRALFDHASDGILLADPKSKEFYIGNKMICQMLGYNLNEIKQLGVNDIHPKKDLPYVIGQFERQLRKELTLAKDITVKRKDGSVFYVDVNSFPITLRGKSYLAGIFRDITERKKAEQILQEQKIALEQKNVALKEVIGQVEIEKNKIKDDIAINVKEVLLPILEKLKIKKAPYKYVDLLKRYLEEITSSFGRKITEESLKLTPREIEICNMIKGGLMSKEISSLLNISSLTVEKHRRNIRKKLGLSNEDINLTTYLQNT